MEVDGLEVFLELLLALEDDGQPSSWDAALADLGLSARFGLPLQKDGGKNAE